MATLKQGVGMSTDTQISLEEQTKINSFSRLNMKFHIKKAEIKALKDELENL